jgi:hypothetical protein
MVCQASNYDDRDNNDGPKYLSSHSNVDEILCTPGLASVLRLGSSLSPRYAPLLDQDLSFIFKKLVVHIEPARVWRDCI